MRSQGCHNKTRIFVSSNVLQWKATEMAALAANSSQFYRLHSVSTPSADSEEGKIPMGLEFFCRFNFCRESVYCVPLQCGELEENYGHFSLSTMNGDISVLGQNCATDASNHISLYLHASRNFTESPNTSQVRKQIKSQKIKIHSRKYKRIAHNNVVLVSKIRFEMFVDVIMFVQGGPHERVTGEGNRGV